MSAPFAPCDVAVFAEFDRWENAAAAEAGALFFLASWIARGGKNCPLHVVGNGDFPASVRALAKRANASVREGVGTRLEALDAHYATGRAFLLDADSLVLRPPTQWTLPDPAARLLLIPSNKPARDIDWPAVYAAAGLPAPDARIGSLRGELRGAPELMWPYYQSRALLSADPASLHAAWSQYLTSPASERVALTLAQQQLGGAGRLPDPLCARLAHWEAGALLPGDTCLLQISGLFQGLVDAGEIRARIDAYGARLAAAAATGVAGQPWWARQRAVWQARGVHRFLRRLFRREIAPVLRATGAYV